MDIASGPSAALANSGIVIADSGLIDVTASLAPGAGTWRIGDTAANTVGTLAIETAAPELNVDFDGSGTIISEWADAGSYAGQNLLLLTQTIGTLSINSTGSLDIAGAIIAGTIAMIAGTSLGFSDTGEIDGTVPAGNTIGTLAGFVATD
ncbi:MAG: hypothetical protein ACREFY_09320, partial [Acetobacteraceae bacterium]